MFIKIITSLLSISLVGSGSFLSLAILVYAAKEHDNIALYVLFFTIGMILPEYIFLYGYSDFPEKMFDSNAVIYINN